MPEEDTAAGPGRSYAPTRQAMLTRPVRTERLVYRAQPDFRRWEWSLYSLPAPSFDPVPLPKWLRAEVTQDLQDARLSILNQHLANFHSAHRFHRTLMAWWSAAGVVVVLLLWVNLGPFDASFLATTYHWTREGVTWAVIGYIILFRIILTWMEWIKYETCRASIRRYCQEWGMGERGLQYTYRETQGPVLLVGPGQYELHVSLREPATPTTSGRGDPWS